MNHLTQSEWTRFQGTISSPRDRALFTLMYWRGLRVSELHQITRSDIDLDAGKIQFTRLKGSYGGIYPLQEPEIQALSTWLNHAKCVQEPDSAIFPLTRFRIYQLFRQYAAEAVLPQKKRHPHVLKHSIATHLLDLGLDIVDVQAWLGHRSIKNTMIYAEITDVRRRAAAEKVRSSLVKTWSAPVWGEVRSGIFNEHAKGHIALRYDEAGVAWCVEHQAELRECMPRHNKGE